MPLLYLNGTAKSLCWQGTGYRMSQECHIFCRLCLVTRVSQGRRGVSRGAGEAVLRGTRVGRSESSRGSRGLELVNGHESNRWKKRSTGEAEKGHEGSQAMGLGASVHAWGDRKTQRARVAEGGRTTRDQEPGVGKRISEESVGQAQERQRTGSSHMPGSMPGEESRRRRRQAITGADEDLSAGQVSTAKLHTRGSSKMR